MGNKTFREPAYYIDLKKANTKTMNALLNLDETFIGTTEYMGLAYWWGQEYKHIMRAVSVTARKNIHDAFLKAGLNLEGDSDQHMEIIVKYAKKICLDIFKQDKEFLETGKF